MNPPLTRWLFVLLVLAFKPVFAAPPHYGRQFVGLEDFSRFTKSAGESTDETVFVSPEIISGLKWDELVVSWNTDLAKEADLRIEARAIYPGHSTKFYTMGVWSGALENHRRRSVKDQNDGDAEVLTDTLRLKLPCERVQIKLVVDGHRAAPRPPVKFLGLCFADTKFDPPVLPPNHHAWGKTIAVPQRSQLDYSEGEQSWCSPTTTSMILAYWADKLNRPTLNRLVPEVAAEVFDPNWPGTGNWPFNTAYAGSFPGMRACVSRFSDVSELEDWIARDLPVALSVANSVLKGVPPREGPDGHVVVCVGFTSEGDVVVNDPGTRRQIRRIFPRQNLVKAWAHSHNTVYLIHPEGADIPKDRFRHWASEN
jgi:hypothetical protein